MIKGPEERPTAPMPRPSRTHRPGQGLDKARPGQDGGAQQGQQGLGCGQAGHTDPDKAWTSVWGTREDTARPENSRRTPRGQNKDTHIASVAGGHLEPGGQEEDTGQQEDTRTRGGHGFASAASRTTGGQEEDNRRTTPKRRVQGCGERLWPVSFS